MIKKFICFIWGHKNILKEFTGETFNAGPHPLSGLPQVGNYYNLKKFDFCVRCGVKSEP